MGTWALTFDDVRLWAGRCHMEVRPVDENRRQALPPSWTRDLSGRTLAFAMTQNTTFPDVLDAQTFRDWRAEPANWLPIAIDIARHHGLPTTAPHNFAAGTNLVVALNATLILKLFPPIFRSQFVSERTTLRQLSGRLELAIPEIIFEGERNDWPYLIMTRLNGVLGAEIWHDVPEDQKERILGQIGETIAQVQAAPLGDLALIEPGWSDFIAQQIQNCMARHVRLGLPSKYLKELEALIGDADRVVPMNGPTVILTGEYIPENFLLGQGRDGWELAGLFDFGDVLTGWGEYDLLGPSAFMTEGRPRRVQRLLQGFGYTQADIDPAMTRRLLTLMFLHRASNPMRSIRIENWPDKAATLADLERMLWPV